MGNHGAASMTPHALGEQLESGEALDGVVAEPLLPPRTLGGRLAYMREGREGRESEVVGSVVATPDRSLRHNCSISSPSSISCMIGPSETVRP